MSDIGEIRIQVESAIGLEKDAIQAGDAAREKAIAGTNLFMGALDAINGAIEKLGAAREEYRQSHELFTAAGDLAMSAIVTLTGASATTNSTDGQKALAGFEDTYGKYYTQIRSSISAFMSAEGLQGVVTSCANQFTSHEDVAILVESERPLFNVVIPPAERYLEGL